MSAQKMAKNLYLGQTKIKPLKPMLGEKADGKSDMICGDCDCYD